MTIELFSRLMTRNGLRAFALLLGVVAFGQSASAQVATEWAVEAPITAIDPVAGTITASGVVAQIPADLTLDGTNGITGANLAALLDSAAPSLVRSIFASAPGAAVGYSGATLKAEGVIVNGVCVTTAAVVELAENVIAGPLDSIDVANETFVVNGVPCSLNQDERFPADILDAGASPLTFADLATGVGTLVTVVGYVHDGQMYAQAVETEIVPTNPGTDTVRITRARGRNRGNNNNELRVDGVVEPFDAAATITISDASTGTVIGVVAVALGDIAGQGAFQIRLRNLAVLPTRVRAVSSNGGEHEFDVSIR
ncbi:MAG: hypothetical protein ACI8P0_005076 [Planctomycetaceae bacterium]|jgi:hypothetical protein